MLIARGLLDDVIAHAREEYDAECCGLIAYAPNGRPADGDRDGGSGRIAVHVHRATNTFAARPGTRSPSAPIPGLASKRFEIDGRELLHTINEFEDAGWELGAIYHSHTHTAPYPSQTDINFAAGWPGLEWIIVGLADPEPEVRCYVIDDGQVREVELRVDAT